MLSFARTARTPGSAITVEVWLLLWHGRWHRIAIAAIVEQGQVLAHVGWAYSLTYGFAAGVDIRSRIEIFKPIGGLPSLASRR
jgi:hypothetical protein